MYGDCNSIVVRLSFSKEELNVTPTEHALSMAAERYLNVMTALLEAARGEWNWDQILLTGGRSHAPYVQAAVQ